MKQLLSFLSIIIVLYSSVILSPGCANMIPPTGGPRDSLPPILMNATPRDSAMQFNSKKINFTFNEFVQLENVTQHLIVSPNPAQLPLVESKLRTVTVTLRDTLEENTTYTLDFGNALRDVNEGNVYKNFQYMFSTGDHLDSFSLDGTLKIAETGKVDSTMLVLLHTNLDDSAVAKERPRYVARVESNGRFHFSNLPAGTFALYALKDESGMKRYMSTTTMFAFADEPVTIPYSGKPIDLAAFIDSIPEPEPASTGTSARAVTRDREREAEVKRLQFQTNLINGSTQDLLTNFEMSFAGAPLKTFDSTKLVLYNELYQRVPTQRVQLDTSRKRIDIINPWVENTTYNLIIDKDFAEDTSGLKLLKSDTINFKTRRTNEYGAVRIRFTNIDTSLHPLLQFVQNDKVVSTHPVLGRTFTAKLFNPGEYNLRVILDANNNGKWDPGKFFGVRRQPEKVIFIEKKYTVRANWDNDLDISL